jgi:phage tail sheath protein FI
MAINPTAPGVYIDEISTLPPSVAPVATGIPAFIGYTKKAMINGSLWTYPSGDPAPPQRITSFKEFEAIFGGPENYDIDFTISDVIDGPGGPLVSRTISVIQTVISRHNMYHSVRSFYDNGGGPCHIVAVGNTTSGTGTLTFAALNKGLDAIKKVDEPTLLVFPESCHLTVMTEHYQLVANALSQCNTLKDRFVIIDCHNDDASTVRSVTNTTLGTANLKYGAVYHPFLRTVLEVPYAESNSTVTDHNIFDGTTNTNPGPLEGKTLTDLSPSGSFANAAAYNQLKAAISDQVSVVLPPSPAMAGIYATVDRERGVWKAPANVSVTAVIAPTKIITAQEQETLNVDASTGKSINAIRVFTGKGILVWGSRTLAGNDNEWRYVPVRRLFIFAEESIQKASEFVVFEPNDKNTWTRLQTLIGSFLTNLWRDGALAGATPEDAFFVNVGLGTTMTPQDILEGKLIIQVGLAAVRPAEFIILQFMHKLQES